MVPLRYCRQVAYTHVFPFLAYFKTGNDFLSTTMAGKNYAIRNWKISISKLMDKKSPPYRIEESKSGLPTLSVMDEEGRTVFLHSRVDPAHEAGAFARQFKPEKFDTLIILGCGLGYHCALLKDLAPRYARIIVIDALSGMNEELKKIPGADFLFAPPFNLLFGYTVDEIEALLAEQVSLESSRGIQVLQHAPSMRAFTSYYGSIKSSLESIIRKESGNMLTKSAFGIRYLRNCLLNIRQLPSCIGISALRGLFQGLPCMVVASGPSIEANLGFLRENQNRLAIIAVDSALPVLSSSGIVPDLVMSIDPQPHIFEHFQHAAMGTSIPVYTLSSHPYAIQRYPGLLSLSSHPLAQLLEHLRPGAVGSVDSRSGTVTGDALECARLMGCGQIGIMGFDSSFPRHQIYARGSAYQRRYASYFQTRISTAETSNLDYIMISSRKLIEDGLHTRRSFIQYREIVERLCSSFTDQNIFRIHSSGLPLRGVPSLSIREFFASYCSTPIPKNEFLVERLDAAQRLSDIISLTEIKTVLLNTRLREDLIRASLSPKASRTLLRKAERYFHIISEAKT